jgi:membrane protease YdiL (CAAX protease family)
MIPTDQRLAVPEALLAFTIALLSLLAVSPMMFRAFGLPAMAINQTLFIAGPVLLIAAVRGGSVRGALGMVGMTWPGWRRTAGGLLVGSSFWYLNLLLIAPIAREYLDGVELERTIDQTILGGGTPLPIVLLTVALFPAICEELLMRGALARSLVPTMGRASAAVLSALLFGLMHLHPAQMLTTFSFGLVLGAATVTTGSAIPAVLMHLCNNTLVLLIGSEAIPSLTDSLRGRPAMWGAIAGFLCIYGGFLLWRGGPGRPRPPAETTS